MNKLEKAQLFIIFFSAGFLIFYFTLSILNNQNFFPIPIPDLFFKITLTILFVFFFEIGVMFVLYPPRFVEDTSNYKVFDYINIMCYN